MNLIKNLHGQTFGLLTALELDTARHGIGKRVKWICKCQCGNTKSIGAKHLVSGATKSCGCLKIGAKSPIWKGYGEIPATHWSAVKKGAEIRNLKIKITIEDAWNLFLKQNRICALSGISLFFHKGGRKRTGNASLDRIDNTKGYIKGNVQWVDSRVNFMKHNQIQKDFIDICKRVARLNK